MKFLHTGDLHIGKILYEAPLLEEQKDMLRQIAAAAAAEKADALVIAGDVYDRSIPSAEAVTVLSEFLTQMSKMGIPVLLISGNHDSGPRLGFAEKILENQKLYISGAPDGLALKQAAFEDPYGKVVFVLLPFIKPSLAGGGSSQEAVRRLLEENHFEPGARKEENCRYVLVTHFFVTDAGKEPELSDSETAVCVGGLDSVDASSFSYFDYVALGHIHKTQRIGQRDIYYAGTPMKYSFSESGQEKGLLLVELAGEKGPVVKKIPLVPVHDMRTIQGRLEELIRPEVAGQADVNDYIRAVLTNEEELIDPIGTLRSVYPNVLQILLKKQEKEQQPYPSASAPEKRKGPLELFEDFYELLCGSPMDGPRREAAAQAIKKAEGEERT